MERACVRGSSLPTATSSGSNSARLATRSSAGDSVIAVSYPAGFYPVPNGSRRSRGGRIAARWARSDSYRTGCSLVGIAVEVAVIALLAYTPGLGDVSHTSDLDAWEWLLPLVWPPLVLEAEEARKEVLGARMLTLAVFVDRRCAPSVPTAGQGHRRAYRVSPPVDGCAPRWRPGCAGRIVVVMRHVTRAPLRRAREAFPRQWRGRTMRRRRMVCRPSPSTVWAGSGGQR
jgi:hypothetical protein